VIAGFAVVIVSIGIRFVLVDNPATATTTGIIAVIAGKTESMATVTFRIVPPDPIPAPVTDSGFLLQAAGAEKLITELE